MTKVKTREGIAADIDHFGKWYLRCCYTVWIPFVLLGTGIIPYRFFGVTIAATFVYVLVLLGIAMQPAPINRQETALASHGKQFDKAGDQ